MHKNTVALKQTRVKTGDLLQLMLDGTARTKTELIELTGLARSTVTGQVDQLVSLGLLRVGGESSSTGGRPPSRFVFNEKASIIAGIDLGATHGIVALADLSGTLIDSERSSIHITEGPHRVLSWATKTLTKLLSKNNLTEASLGGIGIGVPGPVEFSTGRPISPPIMPGWDKYDIPAHIQTQFNVPVLVDNDVNVLAVGEHSTVWKDTSDFIFVKVSTGIGAGIISGGALQRGSQGSAGDLGNVAVPYSTDSPRDPLDQRNLESIAGGPAIAAQLKEAGLDAEGSHDVVQLLQSGNPEAIAATRQAGRELGESLVWVVSLLNPSVIAIGGCISRAGEHLLAGVREVVYKKSIPLASQHLTIVQSQTGSLAGALGATIMVTKHILSPEYVDALLEKQAVE
ncbi:ROK family transcriptional regulator [Lysinibacter sp. HNR]|uniref:ROK family transcriptional regulator n=1 Tax=Lysinibacter sp. HNR TaxID=3031408 RepID=UPI002435534A|nr:ROK family transcriptional regulator [Lysinibacter sp. HNR]WGD37294.1 ROK family transcriptional regulator [Lysinibacter sp. HNR]